MFKIIFWRYHRASRRMEAMPYSPEHKRDTREKILESARRLFNRKGYSGVSIEEIMNAAGLTRGGFYRHFSGKDELYAAGNSCARRRLRPGRSRASRVRSRNVAPNGSSTPISPASTSTIAMAAAR